MTLYFYFFLIAIVFIILTFLFFYIHYGSYRIEVLVSEKDMIKPLVDDRKYRAIRLTNNLEALLISDLSTSRCSSSLSVGVGSFQNDDDIPGLAHFTEHMIFLGSKSYQRPGEFEEYLSDYFGITNAFTEDEKTTFYYEIGCRGFQKSLLMFSRMFAEPLFDITFMNKEIDAVNSENEKNLNQDNWREHQIVKTLANPKHPFHRFNTGNNSTLRNVDLMTLNKRLNAFYNRYYVPNNMKLVVLSNQSLDILQAQVSQFFSDIRLDSLQKEESVKYGELRTKEKAYKKGDLGKFVWYNKIAALPTLDIIFNLDEIVSSFKTKPMDYPAYLLKYSGEGSLINYLKLKKLANKLDVGAITSNKNFSQFALSISLTDNGLKNVMSVIDASFKYINLIRSQNVNYDVYNEIQNITRIQFKFMEKNEKYGDYLASLANSMHDYTYREIIYGEFLHSHYNETLIRTFLNQLTPENSLIILGSNQNYPNKDLMEKFFTNSKIKIEKWYQTKYLNASMNQNYIENLKKLDVIDNANNNSTSYGFKIRPKNEYLTSYSKIVSCYDDKNKDSCNSEIFNTEPTLYLNNTNFKIWYKLDRSFLVPKVNIYLNLISPFLRTDPKEYLTLYVFYNYINTNIETVFSSITDTGGEIKVSFDENGLIFFISVFSDISNKIIDQLFNIIYKSNIDESVFQQYLQMSSDIIEGKNGEMPYLKANELFMKLVKYGVTNFRDMLDIINNSNKTYTEKLENAKNITNKFNKKGNFNYEFFKSTLNSILGSLNINSLVFGYLEENDLEIMKNNVIKFIGTNESKKEGNNLNTNSSLSLNTFNMIDYLHAHKIISQPVTFKINNNLKSEHNHIVENYFQVGTRDYKISLVMNIIEMVWGNMFYYYLRTIKQLGYIVSANKQIIDNYMYFTFVVQGNKKTPPEMNLEIDTVISSLRDKIYGIPDAKFKEVVASIQNELYKKDTNLKERSNKVWSEIFLNTLDFKRKEKLLDEVTKITKSNIIDAFDYIFIDKPQKLSIQIYAGNFISSKTEMEEVYYLNSNVKVKVTSELNAIDQLNSSPVEDITLKNN